MSLAGLLTETVTVRSGSEGEEDEYGTPTLAYETVEEGTDYLARLEQTEALEVTTGRDTFVSDWRLLLPPTAVVTGLDLVEAGGRVFQVVGIPTLHSTPRGPHHIEARLRYVSDAEEEGS